MAVCTRWLTVLLVKEEGRRTEKSQGENPGLTWLDGFIGKFYFLKVTICTTTEKNYPV